MKHISQYKHFDNYFHQSKHQDVTNSIFQVWFKENNNEISYLPLFLLEYIIQSVFLSINEWWWIWLIYLLIIQILILLMRRKRFIKIDSMLIINCPFSNWEICLYVLLGVIFKQSLILSSRLISHLSSIYKCDCKKSFTGE